MFRRPRGEKDKGGGRRNLEDQNAYDAVMAALVSGDLTSQKLGRILSRTLHVSHRQIKRGRAIRQNMEDMDKKQWIRKKSAVPKNAIGQGELEYFPFCLKMNSLPHSCQYSLTIQSTGVQFLSTCIPKNAAG